MDIFSLFKKWDIHKSGFVFIDDFFTHISALMGISINKNEQMLITKEICKISRDKIYMNEIEKFL